MEALLPGPFYFLLFYRTGRGSRLHIGLSAVAAQEQERHDKAQRFGEDRRIPHCVAAEDRREEKKHGTLQRQPAADRDTNSGHGALDGGHKPTDDDVEAQQQIRNAVAPECTDGVGDELIARVRALLEASLEHMAELRRCRLDLLKEKVAANSRALLEG